MSLCQTYEAEVEDWGSGNSSGRPRSCNLSAGLALLIESRIHCHCPFFARKWRHDESDMSRTAKHRMQKTWKESGAHLDKVATTKPVDSGGCARQTLGEPGYGEDRPICATLFAKMSALRQGNLCYSSARVHSSVSMRQSGCRMGCPVIRQYTKGVFMSFHYCQYRSLQRT